MTKMLQINKKITKILQIKNKDQNTTEKIK
jgi:hypothetical protein